MVKRERVTGRVLVPATIGMAALISAGWIGSAWQPRVSYTTQAAQQVAPTAHLPVPARIEDAWLVPDTDARQRIAQRAGVRALRTASEATRANRFDAAASTLATADLGGTPLEPYAEYYRALADLRLRKSAPARARLESLRRSLSAGRLRQLALSAEAEAALSLGDPAGAALVLEDLYPGLTSNRDVVLDQWATALRAAGRPDEAARLWLRLYYEFPTSNLAEPARRQADLTLQGTTVGTPDAFPRDFTRAEALLAAGRRADAEGALRRLEAIAPATAEAGERQARLDRVRLRLAEAVCAQKRCATMAGALTELASRGVAPGETQYLLMVARRELGNAAESRQAFDALVALAPGTAADVWVERALNEQGTALIRADADADAAATFRQLFDRNPSGRFAERAAWKYGWWCYRTGRFDETARVFELAAATIPRANTRPAWLYWAGRARERSGDTDGARQRLTIAAVDYLQSYYGRLAADALTRLGAPVPSDRSLVASVHVATIGGTLSGPSTADDGAATNEDATVAASRDATGSIGTLATDDEPPTAEMISWLVSAGMFDEAIQEMAYAQRAHGRSPKLDATLAWVYRQQGEIRPAINTMRQAYPQYLSVDGDALPPEIQEVIFPLDYVPLIKRYATQNQVDPFLVAALIGQESSYVADVKSPANAWGLMQILPSTGRQIARTEGVAVFRTQMLTDPETNVRLGTRHLAGLIRNHGGVPYALAAYNAGPARVIRWKAERPGVEQAEFIDDIPFPETQIYVKKILGTAVDYRRLYAKVLAE